MTAIAGIGMTPTGQFMVHRGSVTKKQQANSHRQLDFRIFFII